MPFGGHQRGPEPARADASLGSLDIRDTRITDKGLARLPKSCRWAIDAMDTNVTEAARQVLPNAQITLGHDEIGYD
jgi:hypothetical protein